MKGGRECPSSNRKGIRKKERYSRSIQRAQQQQRGNPDCLSGAPEMELSESEFAEVKSSMGDFIAKTRMKQSSITEPELTNPRRIRSSEERVWWKQEEEEEEEITEEQEIEDYRQFWEKRYGTRFGSFDAETSLGPMYCTTGATPRDAFPESCVQFFSIKVTDLDDRLSLPLEVHGFVAARDSVDRNRNYLFRCTRDNCQTLTAEDPFLHLTGPSRAVLVVDPVAIEVQLKVKCKTEFEDEVLAFKCFMVHDRYYLEDGIRISIPGKRCTLEYALALLPVAVEATLSIRVVDGKWPDHYPGLIACSTDDVKEGKLVLLEFQNGELPTDSDGVAELRRRVVSVDYPNGKLTVSVKTSRGRFYACGTVDFRMDVSGGITRICDLVFCKMEVTVYWSLLSCFRV